MSDGRRAGIAGCKFILSYPYPSLTAFAGIDDPRMERAKKRKLGDIIAVAICAVISGADGWGDIETFGNAKMAGGRPRTASRLDRSRQTTIPTK